MTCIYLSSHHHKQYGEHIHHPCKFIIAPKKYLPAPSLLCAFLPLQERMGSPTGAVGMHCLREAADCLGWCLWSHRERATGGARQGWGWS